MIKVKIETVERVYDKFGEIDEGWIIQEIKRLRRDSQSVCILVTVKEYPVDLILPVGSCTVMGEGGRPLKLEEQRIVEAWERHQLNRADFREGELIAFLKQLGRLLDKENQVV